MEIIDAIIRSATLYNNPNYHEGYGLANFYKADSILTLTENLVPTIRLFPNPTNNDFTIEVYTANNYKIEINIYNTNGDIVYNVVRHVNSFSNDSIVVPSLGISKIYVVCVKLKEGILSKKIVFTD